MRIWQRLLLVWLVAPAAFAHAGDVLVKAGKVYTMTGPPVEHGAVRISDGKITRVGVFDGGAKGVQVIDLGAGVIIPGLVDAYSQVGLAAGASEYTREITPEFAVVEAIDWRHREFRELLAEGVTCVGVAPATENVIAGLSCAVKTAGEPAQRRVVEPATGLFITAGSDPARRNRARTRPDSIYVRQPTNRMGVVWVLRSTFDQVRRAPRQEGSVVREALSGKRRLFSVARREFDILALLRIAQEFEFSPTIVGGEEAYKVAGRLAELETPVILAPLSTGSTTGVEGTELAWNRAGLLHEAGVTFAISGKRLLEQARFATRFGLVTEEAIRAVTASPARLLGIDKRVGTLAPGRDADLVAFSGDPLEFTSRIEWVMVDGKIYEKQR